MNGYRIMYDEWLSRYQVIYFHHQKYLKDMDDNENIYIIDKSQTN